MYMKLPILRNEATFGFAYSKKGILSQIIAGAEYIACTHCLIIAGAAAPTEPMVPTPMITFFLLEIRGPFCACTLHSMHFEDMYTESAEHYVRAKIT